jgi:hypothetical protein
MLFCVLFCFPFLLSVSILCIEKMTQINEDVWELNDFVKTFKTKFTLVNLISNVEDFRKKFGGELLRKFKIPLT